MLCPHNETPLLATLGKRKNKDSEFVLVWVCFGDFFFFEADSCSVPQTGIELII